MFEMKTVYFVRHGETPNNAERRFNFPDTPLSETGRKQAEEIAKRCSKLSLEFIVASSMKRACQTASIISERVGIEFGSSDVFVEGTYTSRFFGKSTRDPEVGAIIKTCWENFSNPDFRLEDGENFSDLRNRALAALEYLSNRKENNILVVSHAFFISIVVSVAVFGPNILPDECQGVVRGFDLMENAGLTVLTYDAPIHKSIGEPISPWQLKVWNDHAHLG